MVYYLASCVYQVTGQWSNIKKVKKGHRPVVKIKKRSQTSVQNEKKGKKKGHRPVVKMKKGKKRSQTSGQSRIAAKSP